MTSLVFHVRYAASSLQKNRVTDPVVFVGSGAKILNYIFFGKVR